MRAVGLLALLAFVAGCRTTADSTWVEHALAQHELEAGNTGEAIRILEDCRRRTPDYAMTYLTLAAAWAKQGDTDQFRQNLEKYLTLNPSHHVAGLYLAEAQFKQERWDEAKKTFETYIEVENGVDYKSLSRRQHAYSRLAEIAEKQGNELEKRRRTAQSLFQSALAEIADAGNAGLSEESRERTSEILSSALLELHSAQKIAPKDEGIEREILATNSLSEEVAAGRTGTIALLLSTAQGEKKLEKTTAASLTVPKLPSFKLTAPKE